MKNKHQSRANEYRTKYEISEDNVKTKLRRVRLHEVKLMCSRGDGDERRDAGARDAASDVAASAYKPRETAGRCEVKS